MPAQLKSNSSKLFTHAGFAPVRLALYVIIAVALMIMDQRGSYNQKIGESLESLALPFRLLISAPSKIAGYIGDGFRSKQSLLAENQQLTETLLTQQVKLNRMQALENENQRLRSLLGARANLGEETLVVELLAIDLDPFSHRVVIDRGTDEGVQSGMVMLDANGVMGQVDVVTSSSAEVILISDPNHALPVEVERTGMRSIAFGTGDAAVLMLPNVTINADIKRGDLLLTSGLGKRFPTGYPVARVMTIERSEGRPFARVWALPLARLDRSREALLLNSMPADINEPATGDVTSEVSATSTTEETQ